MEIPDAQQQLDMVTGEESGMAVARNLEITHDVDDNVKAVMRVTQDVDGNVKAARELVQEVGGNVKVVEKVMQSVDDNMKIKIGSAQAYLNFMQVLTNFPLWQNSDERAKSYVTP